MPIIFRDFETRSELLLKAVGAWQYSAHPSTDVWVCGFAVDDQPIQIWTPGNPVPPEWIEAARNPDWQVAAFNDNFERLIERHMMAPRYAWPEVPLERHRCLQASALALALPATLAGVAQALQLEQRKDEAGRRTMMKMARPRKPRASEDPAGIYWWDDAERRAQLYEYVKQDVATERALYHRIGFLPSEEQAHWQLDARINDRGIYLDRKLLEAAIKIAESAQREIGNELKGITAGAVTSINQTAKLLDWLGANGCEVTDLQKPTLRKALTRAQLSQAVRRVIELRLDGAHAAASKLSTMRNWMAADGRVRGCFRYHGASPGRFTSLGIQVQNMKRPTVQDLGTAIETVATGELGYLRARYAQPMSVIGDITRALICAPPGYQLITADFSGIESRLTAWVSGQQSKLEQWATFDRTGNPEDEPYFITGHKIFGLPKELAREPGKTGDLAYGYMGSIGAWRKLAPPGDASTDSEIKQRQQAWRRAHPQTARFWYVLDRAAKMAVRKPGKIVPCRSVAFRYEDSFLRMRLPNARKIAYPFAKLKGNTRGDSVVVFMDNQQGKWIECRHGHGAYGGTWMENAVQAIARDLFVEAMQRLEAAGYSIVMHAHDEACAEVPLDFGSAEEFLKIFTTLPAWAEGLPVAAKVRVGERFCKTTKPEAAELDDKATPNGLTDDDEGEPECETNIPLSPPLYGNKSVSIVAHPPILITPKRASLVDLIGELIDGKICCPFHDDSTPSCHIYPDHFHCYGCDAHGDAVDWLMMIEGLDRNAALRLLEHGVPNMPTLQLHAAENSADTEARRRCALRLWRQAQPIAGTLAERYLIERRRIDLAALADNVDACLRFHPRCPFGPGMRHPCLIVLRRDVTSDEPVSIHRIALTPEGDKIERRMLGRGGVVKLWPAGVQLVVGEGVETTLAAATRISRWGTPLQPAWSAVASGVLSNLPVIPGVERLIILVDNDLNGAGQAAALRCAQRWSRAGKTVVRLTPKRPGFDFNDIVMELAS